MKIWATFIICTLIAGQTRANEWVDPTWEQMIQNAEIIGLFKVEKGGMDETLLSPIKILKGNLSTNIMVQGFNNDSATDEWMEWRALKSKEKAYFFLHRWKDEVRVPTPSTGIVRLNEISNTVQYATFATTTFFNLPSHPVSEFEEFITNTVYFQEQGKPNQNKVQGLRKIIQEEISEQNTNSLPNHLVYYSLWGGSDWIDEFSMITNNPNPSVRYHATEVLEKILPSAKAKTLLMSLLDDPHSLVQGQAVESLMNSEDTNATLALLTQKLASAAPGAVGPSNIMDPNMNVYLGGQLAIIQQIKKHNYATATNELISIARSTTNQEVLTKAFRTLEQFNSPALSDILVHQLGTTNRYLIGEAIRLADRVPKPVDDELRKALERVLVSLDLDSGETQLIFRHLTEQSLPALTPILETILSRKKPKWHDEDYLVKAIQLTQADSPPEDHAMINRILYYWTGIDSRVLEHPRLLKKKIELELYYARRVGSTTIFDTQKYRVKAMAFVSIDFARPEETPNSQTPPHTFYVQLEMTVPRDDPDSPFDAIQDSYEDRSKTSPLTQWREKIAEETNLPSERIGIVCHPASGRGGHANNLDRRIGNSRKIIRPFVEYARRTRSKEAEKLIKLLLKSGMAKHMDCTDLCKQIYD